jgi:gamma-glutamyltranspeptidase/glutathione hydrolase
MMELEVSDLVAIVDLIQSQGGVMTMEDLSECQAEVIQPIKYEYKAKDGNDGVSLWEVSRYN